MEEAMFFSPRVDKKVLCELCPRYCIISAGETGFCGVRKNKGGTLFALTNNKVTSVAVDPVEKKPLYHFYPGIATLSVGTFGCNMRCRHCQNWEISHRTASESGEDMHELSPWSLIGLAKKRGCGALAWTYNEPSIWIEYILESAKLAREAGIVTILVTAGMINPDPLEKLLDAIDAYRLDIKGFSNKFYRDLTGFPVLNTVLKNGISAYRAGAHVEIVTNVIPGWNDSREHLLGLASWIVKELSPHIPWHITAYHPAHSLTVPSTPLTTLKKAKELGEKAGLRYVYIGNISGSEGQNTICPRCAKTLVEREGFWTGENCIKDGYCKYCEYRIEEYRCPGLPFGHSARPL